MGNKIKRGDQIVADFLDSIKENHSSLDAATVNLISQLYSQNKLSNTKLQQGLAELRQIAISDEGTSSSDKTDIE